MRNREWALHFWKPSSVNTPQDCHKRQEIPRVENSCKVGLSPKTKYSARSQQYHVFCKNLDFVKVVETDVKQKKILVKTALENQKPPSFKKNCCPSALKTIPTKYKGNINCIMYYVIYGNFGIKTWPISKSLKDHIQKVETSKYHRVFALFFLQFSDVALLAIILNKD